MGDKTPESLSMDQYFDRLRSDHSPSVLARSGRSARCKPRSRLSQNTAVDSARRLAFYDDGEDMRRRKTVRPVDVVELSSSQSTVEDQPVNLKKRMSVKGEHNKRRRSLSESDEKEAKKSASEVAVADQSAQLVVPFGDQNGNNCIVKPETRRTFTNLRDEVDEASRRESIEKARRVRAMEQFQKEVLNEGQDWQDYRSGSEDTDLEDELFDDFNHLQME